jgi:hypothetical protein
MTAIGATVQPVELPGTPTLKLSSIPGKPYKGQIKSSKVQSVELSTHPLCRSSNPNQADASDDLVSATRESAAQILHKERSFHSHTSALQRSSSTG